MAKKSEIAKWARPARYKVQQHNRCHRCGRSRSYMRKFALCRVCFRQLALVGQLPGVSKSSW